MSEPTASSESFLECIGSMFTSTDECVAFFNGNVWVELIIGVALGTLVVVPLMSWANGLGRARQWKALRRSRADLLISEVDDLVVAARYLLQACREPATQELGYRRDLFDESLDAMLSQLGYIRLWFVSSQTIFPSKMLRGLSEVEADFILLNDRMRGFCSYADVLVTKIRTKEYNADHYRDFETQAADAVERLHRFSSMVLSKYSVLASEKVEGWLTGRLELLLEEWATSCERLAEMANTECKKPLDNLRATASLSEASKDSVQITDRILASVRALSAGEFAPTDKLPSLWEQKIERLSRY